MRKKRYTIILIVAILLLLSIYIINYNSINKKISRDLEINIPSSLEFEYEDTHGGFHGDGVTLAEAKLRNKDISNIIDKSKTNWREAPISLDRQLLIYGSSSDESTTIPNTDGGRIPVIENGYWVFKDRTTKETKERFPDARSGNYSVGVIDLDTNTFYYIKFDS